VGWGEVGAGVACLQIGGRSRAVDEECEEEQDRVFEHRGEHDAGGTQGADDEPAGKPEAPAGPLGDAADGEGCEG
jgi:hypothetical protein